MVHGGSSDGGWVIWETVDHAASFPAAIGNTGRAECEERDLKLSHSTHPGGVVAPFISTRADSRKPER